MQSTFNLGQAPFMNFPAVPRDALQCWYFSPDQAGYISRDFVVQIETFEYFKIINRHTLDGIIEGWLGRGGQEPQYFYEQKRNLTYFDDFFKGQKGIFTFDGIGRYQLISIQPGTPLLFILKEINMEKDNDLKNNHVITVHGDNNLVNTGNNNQIHVQQNNWKGNIEKFKEELGRHLVPMADIEEIAGIVRSNQPDPGTGMPEKAVPWINKMVGKAVNGVWHVGIHAAGALLAETIKGYY